jgi:hypothetical protein
LRVKTFTYRGAAKKIGQRRFTRAEAPQIDCTFSAILGPQMMAVVTPLTKGGA